MNLYESIKRNIKESDNIRCRHCNAIIDDIDNYETDQYWTNDGDRIVYHKCPECGEALEELDFDNDNEIEESDSKAYQFVMLMKVFNEMDLNVI